MRAATLACLALMIATPAMAGPTMYVPVDDPELPTGGLAFVGASAAGDTYVDFPSFQRSDIAGVVRGTVVLVRPAEPAPMQVARLWIDCGKQVFQLASGRLYDASGAQVGATAFTRDAPIPQGTSLARLERVLCAAGPDEASTAFPAVSDWRAALARSKQ